MVVSCCIILYMLYPYSLKKCRPRSYYEFPNDRRFIWLVGKKKVNIYHMSFSNDLCGDVLQYPGFSMDRLEVRKQTILCFCSNGEETPCFLSVLYFRLGLLKIVFPSNGFLIFCLG
jgi:hypothetical protein